MGTDTASEAELFIHHRIISFHLDGLNLAMIHTYLTPIAFFVIESGKIIGGGHRMFQVVTGDSLEKTATATTTVADKSCLFQDVVPDVNQSRIFCFFQRIQQFINRGPSPKSMFCHKIGSDPETHADIINRSRTIFPQMPRLMFGW